MLYIYICVWDDTYKLRSLQSDTIYHVLCAIVIWYLLQIKYCLNQESNIIKAPQKFIFTSTCM